MPISIVMHVYLGIYEDLYQVTFDLSGSFLLLLVQTTVFFRCLQYFIIKEKPNKYDQHSLSNLHLKFP